MLRPRREVLLMQVEARRQLPVLHSDRFRTVLAARGLPAPARAEVTTLQVNLGKRCNLACLHCHVDAGPKRTETLAERTAERIVALLDQSPTVSVLDLTGGAPELCPSFRSLVTEGRRRGLEVIDRSNLAILLEEGMEDLGRFLAEHQVRVVASLPCYTAENVDRQRGRGTFDKCVQALRLLNGLGYARDPRLRLDLVYNPFGANLPPAQAKLEQDYKRRLREDHGIEFDTLLTLTNMPIQRFARQLAQEAGADAYLDLLEGAFNPETLPGLMCRSLVSVDYEGRVFDCDFNQVLSLRGPSLDIWSIGSLSELGGANIALGEHCLACTAGAGSSCSGALAQSRG
jgi:radical SAM/Cys-rich protein